MNKKKIKKILKKTWHFIWEEDSVWSWLVNIALAFVLIKFIVYPFLGLILGTSYPVVAVVSSSMEHNVNFDRWWEANEDYYEGLNIKKDSFESYIFKNGFNKGDIIILIKGRPEKINIGDVIVFDGSRRDPIIHRVIKKWKENDVHYFQTKGDNNKISISGMETKINENRILGKSTFRIPFLGYVKIFFVDYMVAPYCRITGNLFPCRGV